MNQQKLISIPKMITTIKQPGFRIKAQGIVDCTMRNTKTTSSSGGPRNFSMGVRNIFKNFRPLGI
ncbi:hypothetical protein Hdeb2414_s0012g00391961 [Helianthus debilis subsp. tardiflorus]